MNHAERIQLAKATLEHGTLGAETEAAAHASLATYELLAEFLAHVTVSDDTEPPWQRHDLVRWRSDGVEFVALLQHPETKDGDRPWWSAQIVRAVSGSDVMVGTTRYLQEGSPFATVARFPD